MMADSRRAQNVLTFRFTFTDELVIEKEKYKNIGDDLDSAFHELYGW
jgi:hypothetical protein